MKEEESGKVCDHEGKRRENKGELVLERRDQIELVKDARARPDCKKIVQEIKNEAEHTDAEFANRQRASK